MQTQNRFKRILVVSSVALMAFFVAPSAYAASLNFSPSTGSYEDTFTVDLIVDGGSQSFNAAQATVTLSGNLQLTDVIYGDCNFSFLTIPSVMNPSFIGVMLGSSSKRCTAYTMTVSPVSTGQGTITLSNASIREYTTAKELLSSVQNGSYSLTGAQSVVTPVPTTVSTGVAVSSYNLNVKLVSDTNTPLKASQIELTPQDTTAGGSTMQVTTDANGVAKLEDIPPGVYKMLVRDKENVLSERVVTVAGNNPELTFGVRQEKTQTAPPVLLIGGMIFGMVLLVIGLWFFLSRRKNRS